MQDRTLVERERELRELARLIDDARAGDGRLALIEGPAGIGKTRLFHEVRPYAEEVGVRILAARGGELERDFGFGIVRQLLEPVLQRSDPETRADLLAGAARLAEPAFSTAPGEGASAPDPTQATLHGLYWLVANLAELSPRLLVVDDVHWADGPSLRFLIHLARRLDGMAVSVAIAARSGEQAAAPELLRALTLEARPPIIRPEPLSPPASEILIRSRLGSDAGEMLCHACHEATGGNPFLLTELVEELRYDSRPLGEISPATVRTLGPERIAAALLVRVRRVDRSGPALAHAISILGNEATITRVSALAGLDPPVAREVAGKLAEAAVLNSGEPLEFVHPIVRTATYEDIAESERAALHKRAAEILAAEGAEPEAIAVHLLPTNPAGDACVVEHLRAAAAAALVRGGPETTLRYLNRAIVEPPGEELEAVVALELGSAAERAGDPDSIDLLRRAFELARAPEQRAVAAIEFSHAAFSHGFLDDAVKGNEQGLEAAREAEDVELAAHLEGVVLLSATTVGPRWKWRDLLESAYERVDALPAAAARPMLVALCFDKAFCGPTAAQAAELAERAMDAGELLREYTAHSNLVYPPAFVLTFVDRLEAAERAVTECFADASTRGSVHGLVLSAGLRSATRFWRGDLAGAETDARMALELGAEGGLAQMLPLPLASLLAVLLERGQPHEAERVLAEHEPLAGVPDIPPGGPSLHESKARLMWARGELDAALAELRAIERWEREYGATSGVVQVRWRAMAALIHHRLGEHDEALRLATEQVELAKRFEAPIAIGVALRALGIVVGGDTGIERLIEATSVLEQSEGRLEHARALIDLGAALRRTGRATESRDRLGEGMDLAHRLGATALVDVAVDELRMAGARPRRAALRGRDALTPGELRVAEMAAQGMTNKEIAQALFVTLRTVEMHLSNAYGKLEIKSRRELPSALAA